MNSDSLNTIFVSRNKNNLWQKNVEKTNIGIIVHERPEWPFDRARR